MIVPLRTSGRTLGLMFFVSLSLERQFDRDALGLARELADRVAQALENARLLASAQRAQAAAEVSAHELRAAQRRFASAFANAPIGMALVSARDGLASRIDDVNPAFCDLTGFTQDELRGRDLIETLVHPGNRVLAASELEQLVSGALDVINGERRLVRNGGEDVWVQISVAPLGSSPAARASSWSQVQDISDRKRHEGELRYLADHDPLTGLVNRRRFVEELGRMAANAYRHGVADGRARRSTSTTSSTSTTPTAMPPVTSAHGRRRAAARATARHGHRRPARRRRVRRSSSRSRAARTRDGVGAVAARRAARGSLDRRQRPARSSVDALDRRARCSSAETA